MNQDVALREPVSIFKAQISKNEKDFRDALPAHIPVERFSRVVMTAVINNPSLLEADRRSLFDASMKAAQDGLLPDGREGALVIYNTKIKGRNGPDQWIKKVQWMPMIAGILKKVRNSGELLSVASHVVYGNDEFSYELGDDEKVTHRPALAERGEPRLLYAIAKFKDGGIYREIMTVADVNKVRSMSRSKDDGPWVTWWDEMARKTVLRRLAKRLPMSSDLDDLIRRDDSLYDFDGAREGTPPRPRAKTLAGKLEALANEEPPQNLDLQTGELIGNGGGIYPGSPYPDVNISHDPDTGEIITDEMAKKAQKVADAFNDATGEEAARQLKDQLDTRANGLTILEEAHSIARFGSASFKKWADRLPAADYEKIKHHMPALRAEAAKAGGSQ